MKKVWLGLVVALLLILALVATLTAPAAETIKIGGVFALTGPASQWGTGEKDSVLLAFEEANARGGINGKKLELVVEDTKTDFAETAKAFNKLIHVDGVKIIIGPTWFGQVASPIAENERAFVISPSAGVVTQPSRYFFDIWPTEAQEVEPVVRHMNAHNISRVIVIYSQNDWSQSMFDHFKAKANQTNISIVRSFATDPFESDFRTIIDRIKSENFDALYVPFAFYPAQGRFMKQATELKLAAPVYSSSGTENPNLLQEFGPYIEGTLYPYPEAGETTGIFRQKFRAHYGREPTSPSASYAYDSAFLVIAALKAGKKTPEEISAFLATVKDFPGYSNTIGFDQNGRVASKPFSMKVVLNGQFEAAA
jgi:branched-chain amino acid transport system substrate-binding protein